MNVGLVARVVDHFFPWLVQFSCQRHADFHNAQIACQMSAVLGDFFNQKSTEKGAVCVGFGGGKLFHLLRGEKAIHQDRGAKGASETPPSPVVRQVTFCWAASNFSVQPRTSFAPSSKRAKEVSKGSLRYQGLLRSPPDGGAFLQNLGFLSLLRS